MVKSFLLILASIVLTACGTTNVGLKYAAPPTVAKAAAAAPPVMVGTFTDQRGEPPTWLGAIRGGFGNPLKNLESDRPVAEIVNPAFADGLRARGVAIDPANARHRLVGTVKKLDCNQVVRREANVEIELRVVDSAGQTKFTKTYTGTRLDGSLATLSAGVFASVDDLRVTLETTLREVVDQALDDRALRAALQI